MKQINMGLVFFLFVGLGMLMGANGRCPDHCSGHGKCVVQNHRHSTKPGGKFMCECWPGFVGLNCGERDCPYGKSLSDIPYGIDLAHKYAECSGRGECDRKTGECVCYGGT